MLEVAIECVQHEKELSIRNYAYTDYAGHFCSTSSELKKCRKKQQEESTSKLAKVSKMCEKSAESNEKDKLTNQFPEDEVFLGGSCNPTTWRKDIAIPTLKRMGITYYNPQVTHWKESLLEAENLAKKNARIFFFVFDTRTRNVASMVEVGYFTGRGEKKLVLVMDNYSGPEHLINGEAISEREYEELSSGLTTVKTLMNKKSIPIFTQLYHALYSTAKLLRENSNSENTKSSKSCTQTKSDSEAIRLKLRKFDQLCLRLNVDQLTKDEIKSIFEIVAERCPSKEEFQIIFENNPSSNRTSLRRLLKCTSKFTNQSKHCIRIWQTLNKILEIHSLEFKDDSLELYETVNNETIFRDVYLGGPNPSDKNWREVQAIPYLKKLRYSFHTPVEVASYKCISFNEVQRSNDCLGSSKPDLDQNRKETNSCSYNLRKHISYRLQPSSSTSNISIFKPKFFQVSRSKSGSNHKDISPTKQSGIHIPRLKCCQYKSKKLNTLQKLKRQIKSTSPGKDLGLTATNDISMSANSEGSKMLCQSLETSSEDSDYKREVDELLIEMCNVLLFVIPSTQRALSHMILAAHCIGEERNVVLCVQMIQAESIVDGEKLSQAAIKDYNRGRSYLLDQAQKENVPVFNELNEALNAVSEMCRNSR